MSHFVFNNESRGGRGLCFSLHVFFAVKQILDLIGKESVGGKALQSMTSSTESVQ